MTNVENNLIFRHARPDDTDSIMVIIRQAVSRMLAEGKKQWSENYPSWQHIENDIDNKVGYVIECQGKILAYGAVIFSGEPAYLDLRGEWLTNGKYVVVHRMAVNLDYQHRGIATEFLLRVEELAKSQNISSFKVDTNYDNERMLSLLSKNGFVYCGEIRYESGSRKAFEKILN